jgi:predicted deacylase
MIRSYDDITDRVKKLTERGDLTRIEGVIDTTYPIFNITTGTGPTNVLLTAGVHGDEANGVYALLTFLEKHAKEYADDFTFTSFPCLNPGGYEDNTYENRNRIDINENIHTQTDIPEARILVDALKRIDLQYALAVDFHVDVPSDRHGHTKEDSPTDFYMYESSRPAKHIGEHVITAVRKVATVCDWLHTFDDENHEGVIYSTVDMANPGHQQAIEAYVFNRYTPHALTLETPAHWSQEHSIKAHLTALHAALDAIR